MEVKETVTKRYCDICGKPCDGNAWFAAHSAESEVIYESQIVGDYCPEHSEALILNAIKRSGIADRYDRFDDPKDKERQKLLERALIEDEFAGSVFKCG